jgi:hypothetical protein
MRNNTGGANSLDPFAAARGELEFFRRQVEAMAKENMGELESLKEYTLWRLNSMSDRTVEIAREEADGVDELLARDRAEAASELAGWRAALHERIHDEKFLDRLAREAVEALLPREPGAEAAGVSDEDEGRDENRDENRDGNGGDAS